MKSHERKIILGLSSPGGQNHSLVPSFIHSFTQQSSVEHLPLFIRPGSRGTRVKPILPAPKETYSLVGMKVKFQFSKTCVYVFHDALLLWAGVAHWQCAASYVVLFHCPEFWSVHHTWPYHHPAKIFPKSPVNFRIKYEIQSAPKAYFQNLSVFSLICLATPPVYSYSKLISWCAMLFY